MVTDETNGEARRVPRIPLLPMPKCRCFLVSSKFPNLDLTTTFVTFRTSPIDAARGTTDPSAGTTTASRPAPTPTRAGAAAAAAAAAAIATATRAAAVATTTTATAIPGAEAATMTATAAGGGLRRLAMGPRGLRGEQPLRRPPAVRLPLAVVVRGTSPPQPLEALGGPQGRRGPESVGQVEHLRVGQGRRHGVQVRGRRGEGEAGEGAEGEGEGREARPEGGRRC